MLVNGEGFNTLTNLSASFEYFVEYLSFHRKQFICRKFNQGYFGLFQFEIALSLLVYQFIPKSSCADGAAWHVCLLVLRFADSTF